LILFLSAASTAIKAQETSQYDKGTPPQQAAGVSSLGSYMSTDLGTVNLSNGSLNFRIPLGTVGGRGFSIPLTLNYSSKVWSATKGQDYNSTYSAWYPAAYAVYGDPKGGGGWHLGAAPIISAQGVGIIALACPGSNCGGYSKGLTKLTVKLPDKGEVELRDDLYDGAPLSAKPDSSNISRLDDNRGQRWHATDGSGTIFISDNANGVVRGDLNGVLITGDGTRYRFNMTYAGTPMTLNMSAGAYCYSITDRNGNQITISYPSSMETRFTDQLGRITKIQANAPDPANPSVTVPVLVTFPGYSGTTQGTARYFKLKSGVMNQNYRSGINPVLPVINGDHDPQGNSYNVGTATRLFSQSDGAGTERIDNQIVNTELVLPDNRSLRFRYNEYGEVAEVELPTGGKVQYDYAYDGQLPSGNSLSIETRTTFHILSDVSDIDRAVVARRTYTNGTTLDANWSYDYRPQTAPNSVSYPCTEVKATSATGTLLLSQRHFFLAAQRYINTTSGDGTGYSLWSTGVEWCTESRDAANVVMRASEQDWSQRAAVSWSTYTQEQPANDNRVNESRSILDDGQVARVTTTYEPGVTYNNPIEVKEYDYGNTLKRTTTISYVTTNTTGGVTYNYRTDDAIHLLSLPSQRSIIEGGVERARTVYAYDNYTPDANNATLLDYGAVTGHDSAYSGTKLTRGNATRVGSWEDTTNTTLYSYSRFDVAGNVVSTKDARGNVSQVEYASTYVYAYPTHTISAVPGAPYGSTTALETTTAYDLQTGLVTSATDANNQVTTFEYDDPFHRLTKNVRPTGGGWTTYEYTTSAYGDRVHVQSVLNSSGTLADSYQFSDGFGRTYRSFQYEGVDPSNVYLTTDTQYDALGRVRRVSNTYRSVSAAGAINPSGNWTTTAYDALGRVTSVMTPDNAVVTTSYSGNQATVTDQAGKKRRSFTDAMGRLTQVIEDPNGLAYQTDYLYDALNNLRKVTQGTQKQTRFFMYDSLSRLIRAKNPEQDVNGNLTGTDPVTGNTEWVVSYAYDANGNLSFRTDARGVTSSYVYDSLNRNTEVNYSDGSNIRRYYDGSTNGRGREWASYRNPTNGTNSHTAIDGYDALGRVLARRQQFYYGSTWSAAYNVTRTYDLSGHVSTQIYPSGRTVSYSYDRMGRTATFGGNIGDAVTRTYMSALAFDDGGRMTREQFGTDTPLYNKRHYNVRGQLYDFRLSSLNDDSDWNRGAIVNYYSLLNSGFGASGTDNNGNLHIQQTWIPGGSYMQQNYGYDSLNRLSSVGEYQNGATQTGVQNYTYDRWGNRTVAATSSGAGINVQQFTVDPDTNRLGVPSGQAGAMGYDANGNLTNDTYSGLGSRTYDPENRMATAADNGGGVSQYSYDADGHRVRRQTGAQQTWQVYGIDGEMVAEYAAGAAVTTPQKEYGYRNGELLITGEAPSSTGINVAQNRTATQSSDLVGGVAGRAVDGNTNGDWNYSSVTHTDYNNHGWWEVDLGSVQPLSNVKVWNRTDCCASRLSNFYIFVSDVPFTSHDLTITMGQSGVASYYTAGAAGTSVTQAVNRTGRYVRVQLAGADYLSLAEVQVFSANASTGIEWLVSDQLGTPRMVVDKSGTLSGIKRHDYLPFGEELFAGTGNRTTAQGYVADGVRQKFTQKERDNETGLDYFLARYYSSTQGRFTSPDEFTGGPDELFDFADSAADNPTFYADLSNPQSLNKYHYAYNNPLRYVDPDGHDPQGPVVVPEVPTIPIPIPILPQSDPPAIRDGQLIWPPPDINKPVEIPDITKPLPSPDINAPVRIILDPTTPRPQPSRPNIGILQPNTVEGKRKPADQTQSQNKERSPHPPGRRSRFNTEKDAKEAARRETGHPPVNHPRGPHGPHYHPGNAQGKPANHNHYYYPRHRGVPKHTGRENE
jgi:RHS repeat-associated protein